MLLSRLLDIDDKKSPFKYEKFGGFANVFVKFSCRRRPAGRFALKRLIIMMTLPRRLLSTIPWAADHVIIDGNKIRPGQEDAVPPPSVGGGRCLAFRTCHTHAHAGGPIPVPNPFPAFPGGSGHRYIKADIPENADSESRRTDDQIDAESRLFWVSVNNDRYSMISSVG